MPFLPDSISMLYNLPNLSYTNGRNDVPRLRISRNSLIDIFTGQITQWNDPSLVVDNPNVNLPNATIRLILRNDIAGATTGA